MATRKHGAGLTRQEIAAMSKVYKLVRADIRTFLDGLPPTTAKVGQLRSDVWNEITSLSERWYRRGCRRGFMETREQFKSAGKMPKRLSYEYMAKEFFHGRLRDGKVTRK
jgi:hypothetical protein